MEHTTPQPASSKAFVYTPKPPQDIEYFGMSMFGDSAPNTHVFHHAIDGKKANLVTYLRKDHREVGSINTLLTADECESLARSLIDAAHHLRTTDLKHTSNTPQTPQADDTTPLSAKPIFQKIGHSTADPASEDGAVNAQFAKNAIAAAAAAHQVEPPAVAAPMPMWIVLGEAVKPALALVGFRLCLLALRAQIAVLALQQRCALGNGGQSLAQHRRRAALVDERLQLLQQRLYQFVALRGVLSANGSQGGAL
jgi:hypothetical protein